MKKLLSLIVLIFVMGLSQGFASNSYVVDDAAVEKVLSTGVELSSDFDLNTAPVYFSQEQLKAEKDPLVAILLDFFVGGLAIHRVYLGGKPSLILIYLITCGGIFGIVPLVDLIVLAINYDDISAYVDNDKFFMW
jgi:TM2 domain-containing membrane protein YozV